MMSMSQRMVPLRHSSGRNLMGVPTFCDKRGDLGRDIGPQRDGGRDRQRYT